VTIEKRPYDPFILGLLALSLAGNVFAVTAIARPSFVSLPRSASAGAANRAEQVLSAVEGLDLSGQPVRVAFDDSRSTVLYVFTTACPWCKRNIANINALAKAIARDYRVIGVALEADPSRVSAYIRDFGLDIPTVILPNQQTRAVLQLAGVPETIVVGAGGLVSRSWKGAYVATTASEIEQMFAARLPGLATSAEGK
jgi:hypothetical protein